MYCCFVLKSQCRLHNGNAATGIHTYTFRHLRSKSTEIRTSFVCRNIKGYVCKCLKHNKGSVTAHILKHKYRHFTDTAGRYGRQFIDTTWLTSKGYRSHCYYLFSGHYIQCDHSFCFGKQAYGGTNKVI